MHRLVSPREQQGQECQIVLFHMAVFIDAWLGSAPGNHPESVCALKCVCVSALCENDLVMELLLRFLPFPLLAYDVGEARPLFFFLLLLLLAWQSTSTSASDLKPHLSLALSGGSERQHASVASQKLNLSCAETHPPK